MKSIVCDICGGESFFIHKGTRDNPSIDIYECSKCHTKQLNHIVENDYSNGFMNGSNCMSAAEIEARIKDCDQDDKRRASMLESWIKDKDVLDFGCGFGGFIRYASGITRSISGVELGINEIKYLHKCGYDVKNHIEEYEKEFDVVTMFHVFEHLTNPSEWLSVISKKLKKCGLLFIEVPNANDALLSLYNNKSFENFTYWSAHLYLFTKESLKKLIDDNGAFLIEDEGQVQRYPLANHLYWLSKGEPQGQNKWPFFNDEEINSLYSKILEKQNMCDTLFFRIRKK